MESEEGSGNKKCKLNEWDFIILWYVMVDILVG